MARLQSGARRIGGWVRLPGLPALRSPPPPDLPAVQVRASVCQADSNPPSHTAALAPATTLTRKDEDCRAA